MKVGEYVRTDKGIAKYLGLGRDVLKHETNKNTYEHYYNQHLFDNYIFNVEHDYGDTLIYDEFNNIDKLGKVKENITGLIEVGDYVNGIKITSVYDDDKEANDYNLKHKKCLGTNVYDEDYQEKLIYEEDIKSIVTHEQFSQMEYRIGE